MPKEKEPIFVSPLGSALYAHLDKPDTKFDDVGKFKISLKLDPADEGVREFLRELTDHTNAEHDGGHVPFTHDKDGDGDKTGLFIVTFKSKYPPKVFDAFGNPLPEGIKVGNGSTVRVAYREHHYDAFSGGMALWLQAVQVHELVEYTGTDAAGYGFDVEGPEEEAPADDIPF